MRRQTLPTRRKSALWWTVRALLVLALLLWLGPRRLTPKAANRQELARLAEPTETICQTEGPEDKYLIYSWNDDFLCLGAYYRHRLWEWNCHSSEIVQREEGRPFTAGMLSINLTEGNDSQKMRWRRAFVVFGRIEAENVSNIVVEIKGNTDDEDGWESYRKTVESEVSDLVKHEDASWFFWIITPETNLTGWSCAITAYDAEGNDLGTLQALPHYWE